MTILRQTEFWTRESVSNDPDRYYIFGDNEQGIGTGGQACIRGLSNAFGIPTKRSPGMAAEDFWSDDELDANCRLIDEAWLKIPTDKPWVISQEGLGTGLSELPERAPRTYQYLLHKLTTAEFADYRLPEGWGLFLRTNQFNRRGNHNRATSFIWPESGLVEAPDWQPTQECGFGLHGVLWGSGGDVWATDTLWCVFAAPMDIAIECEGGDKHKVPYGFVVYHGTQQGASDFMARYEPNGTRRNYAVTNQGDRSTATQGYGSIANQGYGSTATQGYGSTANQGYGSIATQGYDSTANQGYGSIATQGYDSIATQGYDSTANQGYGSTANQGDRSIATQGYGSVRFVKWWDAQSNRWRGMVAEVFPEGTDTVTPGAIRLDPGKTYRFENGEFVEVTP